MRIATAITVACIVALTQVATAQVNIFEDNEARRQLAEFEERMVTMQGSLRRLAQESTTLTAQKQQLLTSLRELSGLVEETNIIAASQKTRISELDARLSAEVTTTEKRLATAVGALANSLVTNPLDLYTQGLQAREAGKLDSATKQLRTLVQRFPAAIYTPAARYWLARLAQEQGNVDAARDELLAILNQYPDDPRLPDALALLAELADARGAHAEQKHWYRRLLTQHPTTAAADRIRLTQPDINNN